MYHVRWINLDFVLLSKMSTRTLVNISNRKLCYEKNKNPILDTCDNISSRIFIKALTAPGSKFSWNKMPLPKIVTNL